MPACVLCRRLADLPAAGRAEPRRCRAPATALVRATVGCGVTDQGLRRRPAVGVWAGLAGVATVSGAVLVVVAVVATRRLWFGGYISEAGTASSGQAGLYRIGILGLAVGQVLLGAALLVRVR